MTFKKTAAAILAATLITGSAFAMKPVTLVDQGSFLAGGTVVTAPGDYVGTTAATASRISFLKNGTRPTSSMNRGGDGPVVPPWQPPSVPVRTTSCGSITSASASGRLITIT